MDLELLIQLQAQHIAYLERRLQRGEIKYGLGEQQPKG